MKKHPLFYNGRTREEGVGAGAEATVYEGVTMAEHERSRLEESFKRLFLRGFTMPNDERSLLGELLMRLLEKRLKYLMIFFRHKKIYVSMAQQKRTNLNFSGFFKV